MSRPRSGRGSSGSRSAARPAAGGARGVYVQAPKSDIYVALLGVALGAMIIGCILLLVVLSRYNFQTSVSAVAPAPSASVALAANHSLGKIDTVLL